VALVNKSQKPELVVAPYYHLADALKETDVTHVVSILGRADRLDWPSVGTRVALRLEFDDIGYSSGDLVAPTREQIAELIEFARGWNSSGSILFHCRAGSSRSPAAAMIAAASLGRSDSTSLAMRVRMARTYFRPNETMLKLADSLLSPSPGLADLARSVPVPTRIDPWGPIRIPLSTIGD
jgi:predicted protein tyrosine phosphatase